MFQGYARLSEPGRSDELRMVLVGKTGAGKSASGNTILREREAFRSEFSPSTVTNECEKKGSWLDETTLYVIDTPGFFDPEKSDEELAKEIATCISLAAPGPHVFLVVVCPGRFTPEEQNTIKMIRDIFGEKASKFTMALFTHGDYLIKHDTTIDQFIGKNEDLNTFVQQCGGGYHVFNNECRDLFQVRELLKKIKSMVQRNGGGHYNNAMLKEAEEAIQREKERLMAEDPNMTSEEARRRAEKENKFIKGLTATALAAIGAAAGATVEVAVGAAIGSVAGPIGAVVGAATGLVVAGIIFAVRKKWEKKQGTSTQIVQSPVS